MKRLILDPRFAVGLIVGTLIFITATHEAGSALVDWTKHEEWRRKQMAALLLEVKEKGSARYMVMSFKVYDTDQNGFIDEDEASQIETVLKEKPALTKKI